MAEAPLSSQGAESGVVVEFVPSVTRPIVPNDVRTVGLIGKGKTTKSVLSYTVTRGTSPDTSDTLTPNAVALPGTILDENMNSYTLNVDYVLTGGAIDWSPNAAATFTSTEDASAGLDVNNLTFICYVNGGTAQTVTFSGTDPIPQANIVAQLNATLTDVTASVSGNYVAIETDTVNNAQLMIGDGTANSVLGFVGGLLSVGPKEPDANVVYTLDYSTAKLTADYAPKFFTNMDDVVTEYGELGNAAYTLVVGADVVFENSSGTGGIWCVQLNPADAPDLIGYRNALGRLALVDRVNIVVPLVSNPYLYSDVKQHVVNCSAPLEKKERTAILGLPSTATTSQAISYATGLASGGNGRRLLLVYPPVASLYIGSAETSLESWILAAAMAGLRINANYDVAEPLLRKPLLGFTEVVTGLTRTEKLMLRNGGVTVVETVDGVVRVSEDTTVDRTSADNQEYTVTEIVDFTATTTRRLIDAIFIGIKLLPDTPNLVVATLNVILSTLVDLRIINSFQNIKATVNTVDPRQIDVSFSIQPTRTLRFIKITFSI